LQGNRWLTIGDKATTNCAVVGPTTLRVNNPSCTINFQKRAFFKKSTRVVFVPQNGFVFVNTNPKNGPQLINKRVNLFQCFASAFDHGGGTMTLSGNNVTLTLLRQGCPE
jgi:hypothetical protein